jgi:hypothetical protein
VSPAHIHAFIAFVIAQGHSSDMGRVKIAVLWGLQIGEQMGISFHNRMPVEIV